MTFTTDAFLVRCSEGKAFPSLDSYCTYSNKESQGLTLVIVDRQFIGHSSRRCAERRSISYEEVPN